MAILAYARVSTQDQDLSGQIEALTAAGATSIFKEKISGARADRPQLAKLMSALKAGDTVIVTKLDRLGRSTRELLDLIERIAPRTHHSSRWGSAMGHDVLARATALDPAGGDCGV